LFGYVGFGGGKLAVQIFQQILTLGGVCFFCG
jgi:hypothetical protein